MTCQRLLITNAKINCKPCLYAMEALNTVKTSSDYRFIIVYANTVFCLYKVLAHVLQCTCVVVAID